MQQGEFMMNTETTDIIFQKRAFLWVAIVTAIILLIPLIAIQFTAEVNWKLNDFIIMGLLLSGMGSIFVLISRRTHRKHRILIGSLLATLLLYIWAELAVGIFTGLGS